MQIREQLGRVQESVTFCSDYWRESYPRLAACEFDSARKMMSVLCRHGEACFVFCKGAPEVLLPRCTHAIDEEGTQGAAWSGIEVQGVHRPWSTRANPSSRRRRAAGDDPRARGGRAELRVRVERPHSAALPCARVQAGARGAGGGDGRR